MSNRVADTPKLKQKNCFYKFKKEKVFYLNIFLKAIGHQMEYLQKIIWKN